MSLAVVTGATLSCPMAFPPGSPSTLNVSSQTSVTAEGKPIATVKDASLGSNVVPFSMCFSPANPAVAAATAAALGVPTPSACLGTFAGPWTTEQTKVTAGGAPCLTQGCTMTCVYGGTIQITNPGQSKIVL